MKNQTWTKAKCTKCGVLIPSRADWDQSAVRCPRCRFLNSDVEGVVFEIVEHAPHLYEKELPGCVAKLAAIKNAARAHGDGTTAGQWRFIASKIAEEPRFLSLCLKVAKQFTQHDRSQRKAEAANERRELQKAIRTRRLS